MTPRIGVVLKGYPRLSETFIAQELLALEKSGIALALFSLRHPTDTNTHPIHGEIAASVNYLPEYLHQEPLRVFRSWLRVRSRPGYKHAFRCWLADLRRDFTLNRIRRFGQALVLAAEMPNDVTWLYGHFIHTPASVTRYAHLITGLPWSCSAHAKDIWTTPEWELSEKLASACWTVTCTESGFQHLKSLSSQPDKIHLVYHGIDLNRFSPPPSEKKPQPDGGDPYIPVEILSVGRAVEKKGFDTLVDALALLPSSLSWRWTHVGGGDLESQLRRRADKLKLSDRVSFKGKQPQQRILAAYRSADLFVLPCRIAATGDRDGLPNVLLEAASQELACISTPVSGITEFIENGKTGWLVDADNPHTLAGAIEHLARSPELRAHLGAAARGIVREKFDHRKTIKGLIGLFRSAEPERSRETDMISGV